MANEMMWPDVIGVTVVFLISGMFMLGLENTKVFGALMIACMFGIVCQISVVSWLKGTLDNYHQKEAKSLDQLAVVLSCALISFAFPMECPRRLFGRPLKTMYWNGLLISAGIVLLFIVITAGCLTALYNTQAEAFVAVPLIRIMEDLSFGRIIPAVACMLVLTCSGAIMELFPEMYQKIVQLSTSDWKILAKQIGFENTESGSPVLAIFTGGSLCAMLAFACPLQNLLYILAGSHLLGIVSRSIYLLYIPFRPRNLVNNQKEASSSLNYSRLGRRDVTASSEPTTMTMSTSIRKHFSFSNIDVNPLRCQKKRRKVPRDPLEPGEMEREWLLLGEPQSPRLDRPGNSGVDLLSNQTISTKTESVILDTELLGDSQDQVDESQEESDSSTDIDAIVDEYRQKVRVTGDDPLALLRIPSASSWMMTLFLIGVLFGGVFILDLGIYQTSVSYIAMGVGFISISILALYFTPKHVNQKQTEYQNEAVSAITLAASLILCVATLSQSWPALLFWLISGMALVIRCDSWCCPCLDKTEDVAILQEPIFASTHQLYLSAVPPVVLPKGR